MVLFYELFFLYLCFIFILTFFPFLISNQVEFLKIFQLYFIKFLYYYLNNLKIIRNQPIDINFLLAMVISLSLLCFQYFVKILHLSMSLYKINFN